MVLTSTPARTRRGRAMRARALDELRQVRPRPRRRLPRLIEHRPQHVRHLGQLRFDDLEPLPHAGMRVWILADHLDVARHEIERRTDLMRDAGGHLAPPRQGARRAPGLPAGRAPADSSPRARRCGRAAPTSPRARAAAACRSRVPDGRACRSSRQPPCQARRAEAPPRATSRSPAETRLIVFCNSAIGRCTTRRVTASIRRVTRITVGIANPVATSRPRTARLLDARHRD